ncbi:flagellar basal body-associated FliL family protein [Caenispirillum bisanense]|uniref:flagellar basal body-associated FliL family protein n=1 Tax=Caenispirillum bisanense TaxID=414052 RepID=UPI0031E41081
MKRLLLVVFALVLLGGASFVGLVAFGLAPDVLGLGIGPAPMEQQQQQAAPVEPPPPRLDYVNIAPFVVPIILEDGTLHRQLYFDLRLEVTPGTGGQVTRRMPVLHDAFMRYLHQWYPLWMRDHSDIDLPETKVRLKAVAERVVGPGVVQDVLFIAVFDRAT